MTVVLLESQSGNLLLGYMPESVGLFVFGIVLIVLAIGLRWIFKRSENAESEERIKKEV